MAGLFSWSANSWKKLQTGMMMRFLLCILCLTWAGEALAARSCAKPALTPAFEQTEQMYLTEGEYSVERIRGRRWAPGNQSDSAEWLRRIAKYRLTALPANLPVKSWAGCYYNTALDILNELEATLDSSDPYLARWADNQNKVLTSCATGIQQSLIPIGRGDSFPSRAADDLAYQASAMKFYLLSTIADRARRDMEYSVLAEEFLAQARKARSAMQNRAAVMALKLAYGSGGLARLLAVGESLKADPATARAYAHAEDLMIQHGEWMFSKDVSLLEKHLQLLVDMSLERDVPSYSDEPVLQAGYRLSRRRDAYEQLWGLINPGRLTSADPAAGWWFSDTPLADPKRESLRMMARREPYIDLLIINQLRTPLVNWRWALHDPDSLVWQRSNVVSAHAFDRFCAGDGVEWLVEGARLLPPGSPDLELARDHLIRALDDVLLRQRQPLLRGRLFQQAVRLSLLIGDDAGAEALLTQSDIGLSELQDTAAHDSIEDRRSEILSQRMSEALWQTLAWHAHQGRIDRMRSLLAACHLKYCEPRSSILNSHFDLLPFHLMLAENLDQVIALLGKAPENRDAARLWILFDMLPVETLLEIVEKSPESGRSIRGGLGLAERVLMRSWVLGKRGLWRRAVDAYVRVYPDQREDVLRSFSGDEIDRALFFLRHQKVDNSMYERRKVAMAPFSGVGLYNLLPSAATPQRWNGPWCRFNPQDYEMAAAALWEFEPEDAWADRAAQLYTQHWRVMRDRQALTYDASKFAAARAAAYRAHPIWAARDTEEMAALAGIEPAARHVTRILVGDAKRPWLWSRLANRRDMAEGLHLAVRLGLYGCHRRDDDYSADSRAAFDLLHRLYPGSIWAQKTPLWYK